MTRPAVGAGLYASERGVRALGRGGAFVAGADDLGAIGYNPAGLADAGTTLFFDASWVNSKVEFLRRTQVADAAGTLRNYEYPAVQGTTPFLPIPTIGGSYNFGDNHEYTAAFGIHAPYASIVSYPLTVEGQPSPSRYSLVSLDGSVLAITGGYLAYRVNDFFRIGGGFQALVGTFRSQVVFSASPPDRLIGAPEDPDYDAFSQLAASPIVAPSATIGATIIPVRSIRVGLAAQLPFWVNAPASVQVQLPPAALFRKARQEGNDASVSFRLPPVIRAGVEHRARVTDDIELRSELAYVREFWSLHDSIDVRPDNIKLYDVAGFPNPFGIGSISLPRNFQDSDSIRLGGELFARGLFGLHRADVRAGAAYETSAIAPQWVSPLTYDAPKTTLSIGASVHPSSRIRIDAVAAVLVLGSTFVAPSEATVPRINPVKGNPTATEAVNGGDYSASTFVLGLGAQYTIQ